MNGASEVLNDNKLLDEAFERERDRIGLPHSSLVHCSRGFGAGRFVGYVSCALFILSSFSFVEKIF